MGLLDNILDNKAFQLGASIHGANTGNYGQFGPAISGGLNNFYAQQIQQQKLAQQQELQKLQIEQYKKQKEQLDAEIEWKKKNKLYGAPDAAITAHYKDNKTSLQKNLESAGFKPGTEAYNHALLLGVSNGTYMGGNPSIQPQANPFDYNDPAQKIVDPKKRDDLRSKLIEQANKTLSDEAKELNNYRNNINNLKRFKQLSQTNETGGFTSLPGISWARTKVDPEYGTMDSISNQMIPQMRQGLPGAASDRDVAMFAKATVSVDNPNETNDAIADAYIAAQENLIARHEFKQAYFDANGSLSGAEAAWQNYLNDNPIFDHSQQSPVLNDNRIDWKDYFGVESGIKSIKRIK